MLTKLKPNCNTTIISEAAKSQLNDMIQSLINISANFDRQNLVARAAHAANTNCVENHMNQPRRTIIST